MAQHTYRLGEYEFDTYEEYLDGEEDLKKIDVITSEVDINDADIAAGLYMRIRNKEIVFKTKVGRNFFMYLSDIVVNHTIALSEEKKKEEQRKKANVKVSRNYIIAGAFCIIAALGSLGFFYYQDRQNEQSEELFAQLRNQKNMTGAYIVDELSSDAVQGVDLGLYNQTDEIAEENTSIIEAAQSQYIDPGKLTVLPEYAGLREENQDFVGWLDIEGTDINYPIMQSEKEEGQFYLTHNFYGEKDHNGSLFMDYRNDFINRDDNIIIYGHNMKSGAMFGTLKKYLNKDYLDEHKIISFDTVYEHGKYEVIGAFLSKVSYADDEAFRYYNFINAANNKEYEAFKANVMQLEAAGFDAIDTNYGDKLLTLSTCSSYTENGRMFIIAKKIEGEEQ